MHTVNSMCYKDYKFEVDGRKAGIDDIFPGFNPNDRIGIVTRTPGGSMGAGNLIMSALTSFYDFYRPELGDEPGKLRIYPEYFVFHVGQRHMNHTMMDIWPPHKDVIVEEDDPEEILASINDRGITRLVVEDITPTEPTFLRETISSAKRRIVSALAYNPTGRVNQGDIKVMGCAESEKNILASMNMSEEISEELRAQLKINRENITVDNCVVETYRRIEPSQAVHMLTEFTKVGSKTSSYLEVLENNDKYLTKSW
ncbi:hypothetical protein [Oceanobacillus polygoni]|uniref:Uncharacterized protein n=1 Tax=Oceanobacillus polygoni TaxID=1235259 RepID=A0A9X0YUT1_9BACI|nr:hypothetical protein [Oceanobacillus polygoni]MBP2078456.1 hypothetical protein [Oceanobacillus polygoni]